MKTCSNCSLLSRHVIWIYSPVVSTVSVADGSHVSFFLLAPLTTTYSQFYRYTSKSKFILFLHWLQHNHLNLALLFKIAKVKVLQFFLKHLPYLWISFNFKVVITKMTLHAKSVNWSWVIVSYFLFFCIVTHSCEKYTYFKQRLEDYCY